MSEIIFKIANNKYYKDDKEIKETDLSKDLKKWQINYLNKYNKYKLKTLDKIVETQQEKSPQKNNAKFDNQRKLSKAERLYKLKKDMYSIEIGNKQGKPTVTLWKRSSYGYNVFVSYIDYSEAVKQAIIDDLTKKEE